VDDEREHDQTVGEYTRALDCRRRLGYFVRKHILALVELENA
jgi:hypothetical protein